MQKILFFLLLFFIAKSSSLYCQFSGGSGTENAPYLLSTIADLDELRDSIYYGILPLPAPTFWPNNWSREKYFELTNVIDAYLTTPLSGRSTIAITTEPSVAILMVKDLR
jgi:hypothetical protein